MINKPNPAKLTLALLWEGEKPIPYSFYEPLRYSLRDALTELYQERYSENKEAAPTLLDLMRPPNQPPELAKLLEKIFYGEQSINPWDYFEAARGSWWQGGPLKPMNELYFKQLKAELRQHFGEPYEKLAQHFVPYFQKLAEDYR